VIDTDGNSANADVTPAEWVHIPLGGIVAWIPDAGHTGATTIGLRNMVNVDFVPNNTDDPAADIDMEGWTSASNVAVKTHTFNAGIVYPPFTKGALTATSITAPDAYHGADKPRNGEITRYKVLFTLPSEVKEGGAIRVKWTNVTIGDPAEGFYCAVHNTSSAFTKSTCVVDKDNLEWEVFGFDTAAASSALYVEGLLTTPNADGNVTAEVWVYKELPTEFKAPNTGTKSRLIADSGTITLALTNVTDAPLVLNKPK
jgi:hypothetical protein